MKWCVVVVLALVVAGCRVSTGLNKKCNFPKLTDGGRGFVTEREVQEASTAGSTSTRDFIAFGAVECEDLICVRDATFPRLDGGDLELPAEGYCSRSCAEGQVCPSDNPDDDLRPATRLSCRALLLDKETLQRLNPDGGIGANVKEPFFCARGGRADAGP